MSIEEMAKRYADQRVKNNIPKGYQNYSFEIQKSMPIFDGYLVEEACEYGAKAVLGEIENSLQEFTNYEDSLIIRRIIEQLKK